MIPADANIHVNNGRYKIGSATGVDDATTIRVFGIRTEDIPQELRFLLDEYGREDWRTHPGFKEKTRNWLGAHGVFRRVAEALREETESYLGNRQSPEEFTRVLSYYGYGLIRNLHGHHGWEDHSYFPELSSADPRFDDDLTHDIRTPD